MEVGLVTIFLGFMYALFFIAGFYIGKNQQQLGKLTDDMYEGLRQRIHTPPTRSELRRVGAIPTPTAQDIYLRDNPKIAEETESMREVFGSLEVDKK